jgi:ubiquilin
MFGVPGAVPHPAGSTPAQTPPTAASTGAGSPTAGTGPNPAANPFASLFSGPGGLPPGVTQEQMQESLRMLQSGGFGNMFGGGANPFLGGANAFGASSPPPPADTRPPEEIYAEQLRQLNDMGFFDFDQNVAALRRSGGSVQGAIEQLLR